MSYTRKISRYKAVKALIVKRGKVLVLKKKGFIGGEYDLPGGRKKFGESDEEALKREVYEEVGLNIKIIRELNRWKLKLSQKGLVLDGKTYLCESGENEINLSQEHTDGKWISIEELYEARLPSWLREALINYEKIASKSDSQKQTW